MTQERRGRRWRWGHREEMGQVTKEGRGWKRGSRDAGRFIGREGMWRVFRGEEEGDPRREEVPRGGKGGCPGVAARSTHAA